MPSLHVSGSHETNTFVYMWLGARHMLDMAKQTTEGRLYTCIASLMFSAFMLEAYFNHLGSLRNREWDKVERKYPKLEKYKMFAEAAGVGVDLNIYPQKSLVELFNFRDSMAHGKTTTGGIDIELEIEASIIPAFPTTEWQSFATPENAERLLVDAVSLIKEIHRACGYQDDPFAKAGEGLYGVG